MNNLPVGKIEQLSPPPRTMSYNQQLIEDIARLQANDKKIINTNTELERLTAEVTKWRELAAKAIHGITGMSAETDKLQDKIIALNAEKIELLATINCLRSSLENAESMVEQWMAASKAPVSDERIVSLLKKIDSIALDYGSMAWGLPLHVEEIERLMIDCVNTWLKGDNDA